jgi:hypothetical protein
VASSAQRLKAFVRSPDGLLAAIFVVYLVARVVLMLGGQVFTSFDSAAYAYRDDPARNHGPLLSFFGHAPRPWGLPLFYAMFGSDHARAIGQSIVGTVAWAFFAWELSRHMRTRAAQIVAFAGVLALACLNTVASWDYAILTESMSISLGVVVLAFALRWARTGSKVALGLMTAFGVWWTFIRPDIRIFTTVLIVVLLWLAWRAWRGRAPDAPARSPKAILIAAGVLVLGMLWYSAITPAMNETFKPYDGDAVAGNPLSLDEELFVYRLRVDVSTNPEMWAAYKTKLGMPTCPAIQAFTTQAAWQSQAWAQAYLNCPPLVAWVHQHQDPLFWTDIAKADPALATKVFTETVSNTLGGEAYAKVPKVVPSPLERVVFPSRQYGLPIALVGFGAVLALFLVAGGRRRHPRLYAASLVIAGASLLSAVATVAVHSGEYRRFGIQETIGTRIVLVVLLAAAVDAWLSRRRTEPTVIRQQTGADSADAEVLAPSA